MTLLCALGLAVGAGAVLVLLAVVLLYRAALAQADLDYDALDDQARTAVERMARQWRRDVTK